MVHYSINIHTVSEKQSFEEYYTALWGSRWAKLRRSLLLPAAAIPYSEGLVKPYMMDRASVIAAESLRLPLDGLILDACAAPGGKSLVLATRMCGDVSRMACDASRVACDASIVANDANRMACDASGVECDANGMARDASRIARDGARLLCNELSRERRRRLVNVLDEYLDAERRSRVSVSGFDAARAGGKKTEWNRFDAILLDAPCSSERHVIQSQKALAEWTPSRPRQLAARQWSLLSAAFLLLKSGGSLVYATCALSPVENDGPVYRLLRKYPDSVELDEVDFTLGEQTRYGRLILPDEHGGMGPMYVARLRKCKQEERDD